MERYGKKSQQVEILLKINFMLVLFFFNLVLDNNLSLILSWNTFFLHSEQFSDRTGLSSLLLRRNKLDLQRFSLCSARTSDFNWFESWSLLQQWLCITLYITDFLHFLLITIHFLPSLLEEEKQTCDRAVLLRFSVSIPNQQGNTSSKLWDLEALNIKLFGQLRVTFSLPHISSATKRQCTVHEPCAK